MATKKCKACGLIKAATEKNFDFDDRTKDGMSKTCVECARTQSQAELMEKDATCMVCRRSLPMTSKYWHKNGTGFDKTCKACRLKQKKNISKEKMIIKVDFTGYPELYKKIVDEAAEQIRKPSQQVIFYLLNG